LRARPTQQSINQITWGRAVAQAVIRWLPTAAQVRVRAGMWGLWWTKQHWGRFSPSASVSPANQDSTNFSISIITRGWLNRPIDGRSAEWTQVDSTPHYTNKKKQIILLNYWIMNLHYWNITLAILYKIRTTGRKSVQSEGIFYEFCMEFPCLSYVEIFNNQAVKMLA
jgi:hypothetical protein